MIAVFEIDSKFKFKILFNDDISNKEVILGTRESRFVLCVIDGHIRKADLIATFEFRNCIFCFERERMNRMYF